MCFLRCCRRRPKHQTPVLWPPTLTFGRTPHRPPVPPIEYRLNPFPQDHQNHVHFGASPFLPPPTPGILPGTVPRRNRPLPEISRPRRLGSRRRRRENAAAAPSPPEWLQYNTPAPAAPVAPFWANQQQLNPVLSNLRTALQPGIAWDITQFPASAQRRGTRRRRGAAGGQVAIGDILDEPATYPLTGFLTISIAHYNSLPAAWESIWGPIHVRALGTHPLTVETVLNAIHAYFRIPLTPADRARVDWGEWTLISEAYRRRVGPMGKSPNLRAYDEQQGPLRSDVLHGETEFLGLVLSFVGAGEGWYNLVLVAPS